MAGGKLNYCLDSLLSQELPREEYEIIAVDDASTDDSLCILKEYEKRENGHIKVIASPENHRQGSAKNKGLSIATGEWVGFVDSDDWVHPSMYRDLLKKAEETGADFVGCDYSLVAKETMEPGDYQKSTSLEQCGELTKEKHGLHILNPGSMCMKIYKRDVIEKNHLRFPEDVFYEDNYASSYWSLFYSKYAKVEKAYYYYRMDPASTTHRISWQRCLDRMVTAKKLLTDVQAAGLYDVYKAETDYRVMQLFYVITLFSYMQEGKHRKAKHTKQLQKEVVKMLPDFAKNAYYETQVSAEEKKLLNLHQKNNLLFFCYYGLQVAYRKSRKKKEK